MNSGRPVVFILDNAPQIRDSISKVLHFAGFEVKTCGSAREFLSSERPDVPGCIVLTVPRADLSGLELQEKLTDANVDLPIIFVTSDGEAPISVRTVAGGVVRFFTTPYQDQDLLDAVHLALKQNQDSREHRAKMAVLQHRCASLTPREREVFSLVLGGLLNKQIAAQLGASEKTVKIHRGRLMHKMHAESLAALIRMGEELGISVTSVRTYRTKVR